MTAPYRAGDHVAWISDDPAGMRVEQATVMAIEPQEQGWAVETTLGRELVDRRGEGGRLVPIDDEIARDFDERGESFVVRSTIDEIAEDLDPSLDWGDLERSLEQDRDHPDTDR